MTDPKFYIPLAQAAEAAGYAAMTIPDSVAYPFESDSTYPYTPDGNREFLDGKIVHRDVRVDGGPRRLILSMPGPSIRRAWRCAPGPAPVRRAVRRRA